MCWMNVGFWIFKRLCLWLRQNMNLKVKFIKLIYCWRNHEAFSKSHGSILNNDLVISRNLYLSRRVGTWKWVLYILLNDTECHWWTFYTMGIIFKPFRSCSISDWSILPISFHCWISGTRRVDIPWLSGFDKCSLSADLINDAFSVTISCNRGKLSE